MVCEAVEEYAKRKADEVAKEVARKVAIKETIRSGIAYGVDKDNIGSKLLQLGIFKYRILPVAVIFRHIKLRLYAVV